MPKPIIEADSDSESNSDPKQEKYMCHNFSPNNIYKEKTTFNELPMSFRISNADELRKKLCISEEALKDITNRYITLKDKYEKENNDHSIEHQVENSLKNEIETMISKVSDKRSILEQYIKESGELFRNGKEFSEVFVINPNIEYQSTNYDFNTEKRYINDRVRGNSFKSTSKATRSNNLRYDIPKSIDHTHAKI